MKLKKVLALALAASMTFSLVACGGGSKEQTSTETKTETTICTIDGEYITVEAVPGFLSYKLKKA